MIQGRLFEGDYMRCNLMRPNWLFLNFSGNGKSSAPKLAASKSTDSLSLPHLRVSSEKGYAKNNHQEILSALEVLGRVGSGSVNDPFL